jgi:DNA repair exonuclease SbcCD ATPase subunit
MPSKNTRRQELLEEEGLLMDELDRLIGTGEEDSEEATRIRHELFGLRDELKKLRGGQRVAERINVNDMKCSVCGTKFGLDLVGKKCMCVVCACLEVERLRKLLSQAFDAGMAYAVGDHKDFTQTHPDKKTWLRSVVKV